MLGGTLVLILLVLLAVLFLVMGVRVVKQGYVYTIERLGKYTLAANPGLHLIIPFSCLVPSLRSPMTWCREAGSMQTRV